MLTPEGRDRFCDCTDIAVFTWRSTPSSPALEASGQIGRKKSSYGYKPSVLISESPEHVTRGNTSSQMGKALPH